MRSGKAKFDPYKAIEYMGLSPRTYQNWCLDPEFLEITELLRAQRMATLDSLAWDIATGEHESRNGRPDSAMIRHLQNLDAKREGDKASAKASETVGALFAGAMKNMSPEQKALEAEKATVVLERHVAVKDAESD